MGIGLGFRSWVSVLGLGFGFWFWVFVLGLGFGFSVRSCDIDHTLIQVYCCNLSVDVALNVQFTTKGMRVKNNTHILVYEQAIAE